MTAQPFSIVFALYDGMTQLDFTGPLEFLRRTPGSTTTLASRDGGIVRADGLDIGGTAPFASVSACDLLCVPGLAATEVALD